MALIWRQKGWKRETRMRKVKHSNGWETSPLGGGWRRCLHLGIRDEFPEWVTAENPRDEKKPWELQDRETANVRTLSSSPLISQMGKLRLQKGKWLSRVPETGLEFWSSVSIGSDISYTKSQIGQVVQNAWRNFNLDSHEEERVSQDGGEGKQSQGSWTTFITTCEDIKGFNSMESHP